MGYLGHSAQILPDQRKIVLCQGPVVTTRISCIQKRRRRHCQHSNRRVNVASWRFQLRLGLAITIHRLRRVTRRLSSVTPDDFGRCHNFYCACSMMPARLDTCYPSFFNVSLPSAFLSASSFRSGKALWNWLVLVRARTFCVFTCDKQKK